ncbi:flagellar biosynthetic protein [Candidatus Photodesmus katoptron]|uniref:Flagellar biosynthetic protein FliR n=1 Tax=Candidatus Photodesmus katoptron Akat1 TaxID=1236703 RepID=S3E154_9GAMM|nr:flagellar biosynthetic protein FliR [Candidatus Photodesmus katoptron]EPE37911.1 flagellar biosynthetic protein FliR [Candidatus Photodesmus katoptron Akat1]KEY90369.1 flagellar biosynthetic protein [Candidatus Photodesmus katoptron]
MEYPSNSILNWVTNYFLPYARVSSMLMVMSVTGAKFVSSRIRLYLGLAITFIISDIIPQVPDSIVLFSFNGYQALLEQIIIGISMGIITRFTIQAFIILGQILSMQSSLGFASMIDPANGQNTPLLGQLFMFLSIMFFLSTDGHLKMLQLIAISFSSLPIQLNSIQVITFREIALWFSTMFQVALNMSLSGIISLLTINLSFGIMNRTAPQLNIYSLGFSFTLLLGLLLCWYILGGLYSHYEWLYTQAEQQICRLIKLNCN